MFAENNRRKIETEGRPQGLPFNVETVSFKLASVTRSVAFAALLRIYNYIFAKLTQGNASNPGLVADCMLLCRILNDLLSQSGDLCNTSLKQ